MKKIKININRASVSKVEIESKRNFEGVLEQCNAFSKPFYKTKLFLNSLLVVIFAAVTIYTVTKLEREVEKAKAHENDGYAQISDVKEIGSTDSLKVQEFVVQVHKKQRIVTAQGALIEIPANALQSRDSTVVLLVKEAYAMEDMIRAGLIAKSGKELLSSGGMFYIQAKDSAHVKIVKSLLVTIPTDKANYKMKLYKGQRGVAGKIDWQDPVALKNTQTETVSEGEILFNENCKKCHELGKQSVGPDLAHIKKRRDYKKTECFLENSRTLINAPVVENNKTSEKIFYHYDAYYTCLHKKYNEHKNSLNYFHTYGHINIPSIVNYISVESDQKDIPFPSDSLYVCVKKCEEYKVLMSTLYTQKNTLQKTRISKVTDNGPLVKEVNRSMQVLQLPADAVNISADARKSLVHQNYQPSEFYQVEINTFGWYNIDMLSKTIPNVVNSKVFVEVSDTFLNKFQIYLVIPEIKIYGAGGLLKDKKDVYGFYEDNGSIKLPQGKAAHVYLVGERDGKLLYAAASFITDTLNNVLLYPELISKKLFNKKISGLLHGEGMPVKAADSKNASAIRKIDSDLKVLEDKIKEAEKLKPTDCDCSCGEMHKEEDYTSTPE